MGWVYAEFIGTLTLAVVSVPMMRVSPSARGTGSPSSSSSTPFSTVPFELPMSTISHSLPFQDITASVEVRVVGEKGRTGSEFFSFFFF